MVTAPTCSRPPRRLPSTNHCTCLAVCWSKGGLSLAEAHWSRTPLSSPPGPSAWPADGGRRQPATLSLTAADGTIGATLANLSPDDKRIEACHRAPSSSWACSMRCSRPSPRSGDATKGRRAPNRHLPPVGCFPEGLRTSFMAVPAVSAACASPKTPPLRPDLRSPPLPFRAVS